MTTDNERLTEIEVLQLQLASQTLALVQAQCTAASAQAEAARMMAQVHAADLEILRGRLEQARAAGVAKGQAIRTARGLGPRDTIAEDGIITRAPVEATPPATPTAQPGLRSV